MDKKRLRVSFLFTVITGMSIGMMIGAALWNALVSCRIDKYYKDIQYLNTVIENKNTRLEKLEASVNNNKLIVTDIKIHLEFAGKNEELSGEKQNTDEIDELDSMTLESAVRDKYKKLIGREVKEIDSSILGDIVNNRIMVTEEAEYQLNVRRIVLADILEIWLEVERLE